MSARFPDPKLPRDSRAWTRRVEQSLEEILSGRARETRNATAGVKTEMATQVSMAQTIATVESVGGFVAEALMVPEAPTNLVGAGFAYWSPEGSPTSDVVATWDIPLVDTSPEELPVTIDLYELWVGPENAVSEEIFEVPGENEGDPPTTDTRLVADESLFAFGTSSIEPTATLKNVQPGLTVALIVRARAVGGKWSSFSAPVIVEVSQPTVDLGTPSDPIPTAILAIGLEWDGLLGGSAPPQHFSHLIAEMADTAFATFSPVGQSLLGAGTIVVAGVPSGESRAFRFRAVDALGNLSSPSGSVTVTSPSTPGGGSGITISDLPATGTGYSEGDLWFQKIGDEIVGQWGFMGGAWEPQLVSNAIISDLDAGKITVGTLGANVVAATSMQAGALDAFLITGANIQSDAAASRGVKINAAGITGYDAAGAQAFRLVSGTGELFAKGDFQSGSGNSVFKASTQGIQLGHALFASAPFRVTSLGFLTAKNATLEDASISGNITSGGAIFNKLAAQELAVNNLGIDSIGSIRVGSADSASPTALRSSLHGGRLYFHEGPFGGSMPSIGLNGDSDGLSVELPFGGDFSIAGAAEIQGDLAITGLLNGRPHQLPEPVRDGLTLPYAVTNTAAWVDVSLSGDVVEVTLNLPFDCWVDVEVSGWAVANGTSSIRFSSRVSGATSVAPQGGTEYPWGTVGNATTTSSVRIAGRRLYRLNAGLNTITMAALRVGSDAVSLSYAALMAIPVRWAD